MKNPLVKKLDKVFSEYIRKRDTKNGYANCVSCGKFTPYEQLDAGHFINRKWHSTRWNELNVHAQCRACNRFDEGNKGGYAIYMLNNYGQKKVEYLQALSRERAGYTDSDGELMIKEYKQKLKELEKDASVR